MNDFCDFAFQVRKRHTDEDFHTSMLVDHEHDLQEQHCFVDLSSISEPSSSKETLRPQKLGVFKNIRIRNSDTKFRNSESELYEKSDIRNFGYPECRISDHSEWVQRTDRGEDMDTSHGRAHRPVCLWRHDFVVELGFGNERKRRSGLAAPFLDRSTAI
ncbi:hypothetical protein LXL04_014942 [Taraxacum kok-saghyz]